KKHVTEVEYIAKLAESILNGHQPEPIMLMNRSYDHFNGQLIDGRHRLLALAFLSMQHKDFSVPIKVYIAEPKLTYDNIFRLFRQKLLYFWRREKFELIQLINTVYLPQVVDSQ